MIIVPLHEAFQMEIQRVFAGRERQINLIKNYTDWLNERNIPYRFKEPYVLRFDDFFAEDVVAFKLTFGLYDNSAFV